MIKKINGYLSLATANPDEKYLRNYRLNKILIKAMSDYCKERGIRFMLVVLNTLAYIPDVEREYVSIDPTFNVNFFEDDLRNYAILLSIEFLGLQRIFRQSYKTNHIPLHWKHWNYEGHEVVASALTKKLETIKY